jgi:hypothetical protein
MLDSHEFVEYPKSYLIIETEYECAKCSSVFECRTSNDNAVVKFVDEQFRQERWLPTFSKGGYLELVEKCVPGYRRQEELTMQVFRQFEFAFERYQHKPATGGNWSVASGCHCGCCGSSKLKYRSEKLLNSPPIEWLTYDPIT